MWSCNADDIKFLLLQHFACIIITLWNIVAFFEFIKSFFNWIGNSYEFYFINPQIATGMGIGD